MQIHRVEFSLKIKFNTARAVDLFINSSITISDLKCYKLTVTYVTILYLFVFSFTQLYFYCMNWIHICPGARTSSYTLYRIKPRKKILCTKYNFSFVLNIIKNKLLIKIQKFMLQTICFTILSKNSYYAFCMSSKNIQKHCNFNKLTYEIRKPHFFLHIGCEMQNCALCQTNYLNRYDRYQKYMCAPGAVTKFIVIQIYIIV